MLSWKYTKKEKEYPLYRYNIYTRFNELTIKLYIEVLKEKYIKYIKEENRTNIYIYIYIVASILIYLPTSTRSSDVLGAKTLGNPDQFSSFYIIY